MCRVIFFPCLYLAPFLHLKPSFSLSLLRNQWKVFKNDVVYEFLQYHIKQESFIQLVYDLKI